MPCQGVLSVGFGAGPGDYRGFARVAVAKKKGRKLKISSQGSRSHGSSLGKKIIKHRHRSTFRRLSGCGVSSGFRNRALLGKMDAAERGL